MNNYKFSNDSDYWKRWELYSQTQQETLLEEFRRKHPEDHYNKQELEQFLLEKFGPHQ